MVLRERQREKRFGRPLLLADGMVAAGRLLADEMVVVGRSLADGIAAVGRWLADGMAAAGRSLASSSLLMSFIATARPMSRCRAAPRSYAGVSRS